MADLLDGLLPRLYPGLSFLCVPHQGKQDLERSLSRKLRAWREPGVRSARYHPEIGLRSAEDAADAGTAAQVTLGLSRNQDSFKRGNTAGSAHGV